MTAISVAAARADQCAVGDEGGADATGDGGGDGAIAEVDLGDFLGGFVLGGGGDGSIIVLLADGIDADEGL